METQKVIENEEEIDENTSSSGLIWGLVTGAVVVFTGTGGAFYAKRNAKSKDPKDDEETKNKADDVSRSHSRQILMGNNTSAEGIGFDHFK